jgi:epoxide hydrolase-like predicted phosphatase
VTDAATADRPRRGLLVDYGGVLTDSVGRSFRAFERAHGIPKGTVLELLLAAYETHDDGGLVARIELGRMDTPEFDQALGERLREAGYEVAGEDLVARLFDGMRPAGRVWEIVAQARAQGVATALLSNSWGTASYPRERLDQLFDVQVISGEVGLRKPDPAIFHLTLEQLGLPAGRCAFVDDLDRNVAAAAELGMFGVLHRDATTTAAELAGFLGLSFDLPPDDGAAGA